MRRHVLTLALVLTPMAALAQASVTVEVRAPSGQSGEGRVTLTSDAGRSYACETDHGSCTIRDVAGGRYVVRLVPRGGGEPPEARSVMIPPSGSVTLRVSTL